MRTLLMVDDEAHTLDAVEKHIRWTDCGIDRVLRAESAAVALRVIQHEPVDMMLCDVEMPGGSGIDLIEKLRAGDQDIPCVLLTCHTEFDIMRSAIQLGVCDYVSKPIHYEELENAIKRMAKAYAESADPFGTDAEDGVPEDIQKRVKRYVREHMVERISVNDIAEALHFHPKYLSRAFRQRTGLSIAEYIVAERQKAAKEFLVAGNTPICVIGELVGYPDNNYFARIFKAEAGMTPSQYRQMYQKKRD